MQPSPPSRTGYQIPKKSSGNSTFASTKTVTSQEGETFNLKPKYKITDQYSTFKNSSPEPKLKVRYQQQKYNSTKKVNQYEQNKLTKEQQQLKIVVNVSKQAPKVISTNHITFKHQNA